MDQEKIWDKEYKNGIKWNKLTISLPNKCKNKRVLELGVGNGKTLLSILKQKPKKVHAIDFSAEAIKLCKKNIQIDNVKFIKGNVTNLPYKKEYFDVVVCYYLLNNLSEKERILTIKEISRVLKRKGLILFEDFAQGDFRSKKSDTKKNTGRVCHYFSLKEVKSIFKDFKTINLSKKEFYITRKKPLLIRKLISGIFTSK